MTSLANTCICKAAVFFICRSAESADSGGKVTIVTRSLQLLMILEHLHPHVLKELPTSAKLARLMCVYLIGELSIAELELILVMSLNSVVQWDILSLMLHGCLVQSNC